MSDLLRRVERYLVNTGMTASRFGREAAGDPRLVFDLRNGREPRTDKLRAKVERFLAAPPVPKVVARTAPKPTRESAWTRERDEELWKLAASGLGRADIAEQLGASVSVIYERLRLLSAYRGPLPRVRGVWTQDRDEQLWAMLGQGGPRKQIANQLGVSMSAVHNRIIKLANERLPDRRREGPRESLPALIRSSSGLPSHAPEPSF